MVLTVTITSVKACATYRITTWNTYIDDDWGRGSGKHHMQKRVCFMLRTLGLEPREVFATNLVFVRSPRWTPAQAGFIPGCLRVHRMFLGIVKPHTVLTFGKAAFDALIDRKSVV